MEPLDEELGSLLEREVAGCQFRDVRHGKRLVTLLAQLSGQIGGSIPFACQDWAATKAAYRFLLHARVDEEKIRRFWLDNFSARGGVLPPWKTLRQGTETTKRPTVGVNGVAPPFLEEALERFFWSGILVSNRGGSLMTRSNVTQRLAEAVRVAAQRFPDLPRRSISPHTIRHTTAMHLLQSGVDITVIALWLGHESPATTHIYIEADITMKERALNRLQSVGPKRSR